MVRQVYDETVQLKRADSVMHVLSQDNLTDWAKWYWKGVLSRLAKSQAQVDYTFKNVKTEEVIKNV